MAENDVLHLTSNIQLKKTLVIMEFDTKGQFHFVYSDMANALNMLFFPHAMGINKIKNNSK